MFRAGFDAQPAGAALFGVDEQRLLPAVRRPFESADESQTNSQVGRKRFHFEDGVWAGGDTIRFAFAFVAINDGNEDARVLSAGGGIGHLRFFHLVCHLVELEIRENLRDGKNEQEYEENKILPAGERSDEHVLRFA